MTPVENLAKDFAPFARRDWALEQTLRALAQLQKEGQIKTLPAEQCQFLVLDGKTSTELTVASSGEIIIPAGKLNLHENLLFSLGPHTTLFLEQSPVLKQLGCEIQLTGKSRENLVLKICGREIKIFLGNTPYSKGNINPERGNFPLQPEAILVIAALALTPEGLLDKAVSEGILIGNLVSQPKPAIIAFAAALPDRYLKVNRAESLYPIPPEKLQSIFNLNSSAPKPVVVCWTK